MSIKERIIYEVDRLPEKNVEKILEFINFQKFNLGIGVEPIYPLDEFDYELAKKADEYTDNSAISFEEALKSSGLTYEDLQN